MGCKCVVAVVVDAVVSCCCRASVETPPLLETILPRRLRKRIHSKTAHLAGWNSRNGPEKMRPPRMAPFIHQKSVTSGTRHERPLFRGKFVGLLTQRKYSQEVALDADGAGSGKWRRVFLVACRNAAESTARRREGGGRVLVASLLSAFTSRRSFGSSCLPENHEPSGGLVTGLWLSARNSMTN